jgi:signal peptidase I
MTQMILAFDSPWWVITAIAVAAALRVWWARLGSLPQWVNQALIGTMSGAMVVLLVHVIRSAAQRPQDVVFGPLLFLKWTLGVLAWATLMYQVIFRYKEDFHKYRAGLLELADSALIALLLVFCILRPFVIQAFYIPSGSMKPTLLVNDRILVNKFGYFFQEPKVGDIVVFRAPVPAVRPGEKKDFIKRVVGLPGDRLEVHGGKLYRNGAPVNEPWLVERKDDTLYHDGKPVGPAPPGLDIESSEHELSDEGSFVSNVPDYEWPSPSYPAPGPEGAQIMSGDFTVPPGKIMVMGDNRPNSLDGHCWGPLVRENLLGKAMLIFWPLSRVQVLH